MRKILILFALVALIVSASASWYTPSQNYTTTGYVVGAAIDTGRGIDIANTSPSRINGNLEVTGAVTYGSNITNGVIGEPIWIDDALQVTDTAALNETTVTNLTASGTIRGAVVGALTGTASRVAVGTFIDTNYGLKNATTNKAQINLSASSGLEFGSGATQGALKIDPTDASLTLASGGVSVRAGLVKRTLASGTAAATNVTVSGMAVGDELISVISYTTASSIASMADRTSEYTVGSGKLVKASGTNSTGNQLDIIWLDRTA